MDYKMAYERWKQSSVLDNDMKQALEQLETDPGRLEDAFYKDLEFGTGGMRGEIGPGTNRINRYTVRKAAEGLARYIEEQGEEAKGRGVVIAYDSRHMSAEFALEAALTIGNHQIQTYLFHELRPTPELSFAVRYLHAFAGIVITASHNPPEYNGFKVYGPDGAQLSLEPASNLVDRVNEVEDELQVEVAKEEELKAAGLLTVLGKEVDEAYYKQLQSIVVNPDVLKENGKDVKIVFSPLHGTANIPVRQILERSGFTNVTVVKEQELPDPNFSTVTSPNPEEQAAFALAIEYGEKVDADVLIATDPDADRVGVSVKDNEGNYVVLTGNQTGALLLEYILSQKQAKGVLPQNGIVFKTIVTSELGRAIAEHYDIKIEDTLTGFKFIGEKIKRYEETGEYTFLFGYEESYGYLIGDFVRDKDAVQTCLLISELAAYYKSRNMTLYDGLLEVFDKYGYYLEGLESLTLKGKAGVEKMNSILAHLRTEPLESLDETRVTMMEDYASSIRHHALSETEEAIHLPKSNVIKYLLEDGSWVCVRPSGTEPKIKFYFGVKQATLKESKDRLAGLKEKTMAVIQQLG